MATGVLVLTFIALTATDAAAKARPLAARISWLEQRVKQHRFACLHPRVRRSGWHCRAIVWTRRELAEARAEWERAWWLWLPDKYARVGACETGYGKRPGRWDWDSGRYVSFAGIYRPAYDQFARRLGLPTWNGHNTPWQQYKIAEAIQERYSWSAWGCGGA